MIDPVPTDAAKGQPGMATAALFGCCPRCHAKTLFAGYARFADRCRVCGLDFTRFNVGDGPAAFLTLVIGTLVTALAIWVQLKFDPPFWVHILLWVPVTIGGVLGGLRGTKAWLLQAEYRRSAKEAVTADWTMGPDEPVDGPEA